MTKTRVGFAVLIWAIAVSAFVAVATLEAYTLYVPGKLNNLLYSDPALTADSRGGWRLMTDDEVSDRVQMRALDSIPWAVVGSGLLFVIVWVLSSRVNEPQMVKAVLLGIPIGAVSGGALSLVVYLFIGGWGPPYLPSAVAEGLVLGVALPFIMPRRKVA